MTQRSTADEDPVLGRSLSAGGDLPRPGRRRGRPRRARHVSAASVQRQVALAGIALLAAIVALALTARDKGQAITGIPQPVPVAGGSWYSALAGAERPRFGRRTRCGYVLKANTV